MGEIFGKAPNENGGQTNEKEERTNVVDIIYRCEMGGEGANGTTRNADHGRMVRGIEDTHTMTA